MANQVSQDERPGHLSGWSQQRAWAEPWTPAPGPALFVVPHPDDEVLIMGGLFRSVVSDQRYGPVTVVAVTDGEAAYGIDGSHALAARREGEQRDALAQLGSACRTDVVRLGLADSRVAESESVLAEVICELVRPDWLVVSPWRHDHHSDHEACGRASLGAARAAGCEIAEGLFWGWQHPPPADYPSLRRFELTGADIEAKRAALRSHRSQWSPDPPHEPVLTASDLAPMDWNDEYYVVTRSDRP